jgi:hypothetical protein
VLIDPDGVELVHKAALMFAARRNYQSAGHESDRKLGDRMECEVKALLDRIRDAWAACDAAAAATDPDPGDPPGKPWPGPHGLQTRCPGRTSVELMAGQMVARLAQLRRRRPCPADEYSQLFGWLLSLTGWTQRDVAHVLDLLAPQPPGPEGGAA